MKLFSFKKSKMVDVDLKTYTVVESAKFLGIPCSKIITTKKIEIIKEKMKHNIKMKTEVLNLLNSGLNVKEVSTQTKVTEKTIAKWVRKWNANDKPKKEALDALWLKLKEQSNNEKLNSTEIAEITKSIQKLQGELLIFGKYINL